MISSSFIIYFLTSILDDVFLPQELDSYIPASDSDKALIEAYRMLEKERVVLLKVLAKTKDRLRKARAGLLLERGALDREKKTLQHERDELEKDKRIHRMKADVLQCQLKEWISNN